MSFSTTHKASIYTTTMTPLLLGSNELVEPLTASHDSQKIWQRIEQILTNGRELRVAYLLFHCGLTANEIVHRSPQEFANLQEILTLRCSVMKKLISHM